ncbi:MarR family winged helix-turn-helix transcriptional regulator [Lacisediminihabitans sp.]|jgi:DNA-binding MarR family transcriptional regulator|uniref:MarR family winged helix-turn-helix transcriptional regulator n=1 Tax=Lacisediminihabitans sp. TaxID=2787631 RepID=UPI002F94787F
MPTERSRLLEDLIVSAHRLTRVAAQLTGSTTPAAVWRTLSILTTDGSLRVGDLARASRVTQPTMTKLVQHLAEEELVYRIADVDDSRAWLIAITPKGTTALENWRRELAEALSPVFSDLTDDEATILEKAVAILQVHTSTTRKVA